jgi:hypothetical protein
MKPIFCHHSTVQAGRRCAELMLALIVSVAALMPSAALALEPASAEAAPPEVVVGDLVWRMVSLRVTQPQPYRGGSLYSNAFITLQVRNTSAAPVLLNYVSDSGRVVDDRGYVYEQNWMTTVEGVGLATKNQASSEYVVPPGAAITARIMLPRQFKKNETLGNSFDFSAEFLSVEDLGEGRLRNLRKYPVSFIGLQKASIVQGQVEEVGGQLKKAFGSIFK